MAGPQDFMAPVPSLRVDTAPMLAIGNMLSNLPFNIAKGYETGTNIALQRALADPKDYTDEQGNLDWNKIVKIGAQRGGLPFIEKLAPYIYQFGNPGDLEKAIQGITAQQPPTPSSSGGDATAQAAGTAHITGRDTSTQPKFTGSGTKEDPFDLRNEGGVKFFNASENFPKGTWYTVGGYVGQKGGGPAVNTGSGPTPPLGKLSPAMREQAAQSDQAAAGTQPGGGGASVAGPSGPITPTATPGEVAEAKQRLAQRFQRGDQFNTFEQQPASPVPAMPQQPPAPALQPTARQPAPAAQPMRPSAEDRPAAVLPEIPKYTPVVRPPLSARDPAADDPEIQRLQAEANRARQMAATIGMHNPAHRFDKEIETWNQYNAELEKKIATKAETLRKPFEKYNEARAQGFTSPMEQKAFEESQKAEVEAGNRQREALNAGSIQLRTEVEPFIDNGKSLLNSGTLYTGFGADTALKFNQAKQLWGDKNAAAPQESFQKTIANAQLGLANMQRVMAAIGGSQGGASRLFAAQINLIGKASASLENTVAGNRVLMELAQREGRAFHDMQNLASQFLKAGHPYLNQDFVELFDRYLEKNPIIRPDEAKDPAKYLGAPEVPKDIAKKGGDALTKWQHDVGLKEGDPVRAPNGVYFKALKLQVNPSHYGPNPPGTQ